MIKKEYALLAVGELLGDFIGTEITENIFSTSKFERFQGGSPTNLASNTTKTYATPRLLQILSWWFFTFSNIWAQRGHYMSILPLTP